MLLVLLTLGTSFAFASSAYSLDDAQPGTESDAQDANPRYSGWEQIDSDIYFYKSDGTKTTGWTKINKKIFHFKSNGKLSLGLTKIGKKSFIATK